VIRFEAVQLRRLAADVVQQLNVTNTVQVLEVRELTDGSWMVVFEDRYPDTRFPGFEIGIQPEWSPEEAVRELRLELRNKLWICPLCQRRSQIRRIIDRALFRVECDRCGRFEIEHDLLKFLREAFESGDPAVVAQLSRLSASIARSGDMPVLSPDNWQQLAEAGPD
jgi:hypothetical protein